MADQDAAFVAGPAGRPPTREEAEAMAAALFEQIAKPRQDDGKAEGDTSPPSRS